MITLDGLETVANIISYLDSETEHQIMNDLTNDNKVLGEKIQDKIFPLPAPCRIRQEKYASINERKLKMKI